MTIAVVRPDGTWHVRPETSHKRDLDEFYLPDGFEAAEVCNCLYLRLIKTGKAIGEKFVGRYCDSVGRGLSIYCQPGDVSVVDCSTILYTDNLRPASELPEEDRRRIAEGICSVSRLMTLKKGDLMLFENGESATLRQGETFGKLTVK